MTISSTTSRWEFAGDGSTVDFTYANKIFNDSDLLVYVDGTLQTLTTDYTVSGAGNAAGGTVTFVTAPANGTEVTIIRSVPDTQGTDFPVGGPFPSDSVEDAFDKRTVVSQQVDEAADRALKFLSTDQNLPSAELPALASLKGKVLSFNSSTGAPEASAFADISVAIDVNLTSEADNDLLVFDGANWVNETPAEVRTTLGLEAAYEDVASATTTDIGAASSQNVRITGTTTITGLGTADAGVYRRVRFAAALTLTHNGTSLILPGTANITTAADDTATFISLGSGNWLCTSYKRATALPVAFVDEDDMSSDSAVLVPSQQSVKAYVDSEALELGDLLDTSSGTSVNTSTLGQSSPRVIMIEFDAVSLDGTNDYEVQIGTSGGVETSGYVSGSQAGTSYSSGTSGFVIRSTSGSLALSGHFFLTNMTGNVWVASHSINTTAAVVNGGGTKTLAGALTQITIKPKGSNNFDGGQIRIRSW